MHFRDYCWRWLCESWKHSYGVADFVAGAVGLFGPVLCYVVGLQPDDAPDLAWQIPLAVFGALFVVRFVGAPYWLHVASDKQWTTRLKAAQDEITTRDAEIVTLKQTDVSLLIEEDFNIALVMNGRIDLLVKSTATSRTVHAVSLTLVEFIQVPACHQFINEAWPFGVNSNGDAASDLDAGSQLRVPFVELRDGQFVRVLAGEFGHTNWYGNANGAMYRVSVRATGRNAHPVTVSYIVGTAKSGLFFRRLEHIPAPRERCYV